VSGLAWLDALGPQKIRPGLARTRALLAMLGNPERSFRSLLIAGTNGKGSTAATAASILRAAGVSVGLYTSPHLLEVTERIRVDEEDVTPRALDAVLGLLEAVSGPLPPTYFEALTVAAFEVFRRARVAVAVLEVGLGGRLDATNVVEPEVSVVTNVGLDHVEVLGGTLSSIAKEKAGVLRAGVPAFTAADGEGLRTLASEAERIGAPLVSVPPTDRWDLLTPLAGGHQRSNLALAATAASTLVPLDEGTIARGVAATRWPGRLQRVALAGRRRPLLLDGAHNPDGAAALARHLDDAGLSGRVDLVFGGLADKDLPAMFALLRPRVRRVALVAPRSERAEPPGSLAARLGGADLPVAEGLSDALRLLGDDPQAGPVLVTGSLVLVGDALRLARG
jgi:dihydrofolate synthase/folylpolyglutamate synthase